MINESIELFTRRGFTLMKEEKNESLKRMKKRKVKEKEKKKKGIFRRLLTLFSLLLLSLIALSSIALLMAVLLVDKELKTLPTVDAQFLNTYPTSEITDKDGNVIWKPTEYRVETIEYDEIPELYKDILIAVEDKEFWESKGFSPTGVTNMVLGTIKSKIDDSYEARGGSTIDQQLIKNKYFDGGRGHNVVTRKIQEIFLSMQLNENFTKEEILTFYVNDLSFAENAKGIKTIMKTYFNKTPNDYAERTPENIAEQAYLVGLSQAPSAYNLYTSPENARKRMLTVLGVALEDGIITEKEYNDAKAHNLTDNLQERNWESNEQIKKNLKYKTYTDGVKKELKDLGYDIDNLTMKIVTHLDTELYEQIENKVREDSYYLDKDQQIAVSVVNTDGIVVGMVGSRTGEDELNRAIQTTRSTGSSTKHLLAYAPLLQYFGDQYTTASKFDTSNYKYPGSSAVMHNYAKGVYGQQTMHQSLVKSYNTPVGRIMDGILGSDRIKTFMSRFDLDIQDKFTSVDGLGIHASTLQVASAFNAFNNSGEYIAPRFIDKIIFSNGEEKVIEPNKRQAMNPSVAWTVNHMLRSVPQKGGTAYAAHIPGFEGYAGKTGTVGFDKSVKPPAPYGIGSSDLWYNSITNGGYSISVWTGYDTPNTSPQLPSRYNKHLILGRDLQKMLNKEAPKVWSKPEGVQLVSGEGLNAYYRVTDSSKNLLQEPNWSDLNDYNKLNLNDVVGNQDVDENWESKEKSKWFQYYKNGGELNPIIIDEELYNMIRGNE